MASPESGPNPKYDNFRTAGKFATIGLVVLTGRLGMEVDDAKDALVVAGLGFLDVGLGYLSFRDSFLGRYLGRRFNSGKSVSNNRESNTQLAAIAVAFGSILSVSLAADQHLNDQRPDEADRQPPVLTLPPRPTEVTVITNPTTSPNGTGVSTPDYPCELEPFSPDGDGFSSTGSGKQIEKLQAGINALAPRLDIDPIAVTGNLVGNQESAAAITVFKEWSAVQLGDSFVPGRQGQVTPQMCDMLDLWNDGDPSTP